MTAIEKLADACREMVDWHFAVSHEPNKQLNQVIDGLIDAIAAYESELALVNLAPTEAANAAADELGVFSFGNTKEDERNRMAAIIQRHTPPVNERLLALVNAVDDTVAGLCCDDVLVDGVLVNWFDARKEALAALEAK